MRAFWSSVTVPPLRVLRHDAAPKALPAAVSYAIDTANQERITARWIVEAANMPVRPEAELLLGQPITARRTIRRSSACVWRRAFRMAKDTST